MEFGHGFQNVVRQRVGIREALVQPVGGDQRGVERFHAVRVLRPLRVIRRGFRLRCFRGNGLRGFRRNGLRGFRGNGLRGFRGNGLRGFCGNRLRGLRGNRLRGLRGNRLGGLRGNGHRGFAVHVLAGQDGRIGLLVDVAVGAVVLSHGGQLVCHIRVIVVLEPRHGFQNVVRQRVDIREALVQPVGGDQRGVERLHAVRILRPLRIIRRGFRLRRFRRSRRRRIRRSRSRRVRRSRSRSRRRRRSRCRRRIDVHEVLQQDVAGLAELVAHASPRAVRRQHRQLRALLRRAQQRGIRGRSLEHLRAVRRYLHGYAAAQIPERVGRGGRLRGGRGGGGRVALEQRALRRFVSGAGCLDAGALLERGHGLLRLAAVHTVGVAGLVAQPDQPRLQLANALVAVAGHEGHIAVVVGRVVVKERLLHGHGGDAVCVEAVLPLEVPHAARHLRGVFIALGGAGQVVQLHQPANKFGDAFAAVAASKFYVAEVLGGALRKERPQRFLIGLTGLVQTLLLLEGGDSLLRALAVYAVGGARVVAQRLQFGLHAAHARAAVSVLQRQIGIIGGHFAREQHALQLGGRHAGHGHAQIALQLLDGNLRLLAEDAVGGVIQIAQLDQLFLQVLHVRVAVFALQILVHGRNRRGRRRVGRSGRGRGRRAVGGADVHVVVVPRVLHGAALLQAVVNHKLFAGGGEQRLVLRHVGVGLLEQHIGRVLAGGRAHAIDGVIRVDHIEIFARGHELRHQLAQHAADHLVVAAGQVKARDFRHPAGAAQIVHRAVVGGKGAHVLRDGQREVVHRVQTQAELAGLGQDNFHAGSHRALGYGLLVRRKRHAAAQQLHIQEAAALARKHGAVDGHGQREHRLLAGAGHHVHLAEGRIPRQHMDALRVGAVHIIDVAAHLVQQRVTRNRRCEQLRLAGRSGLHLLLALLGAGLDRVGQKINGHAIQSARRAVRVRRLIVGVSVMHAHDVVRAAGDQRIGVPRLKQRVILPAVYAVNAAAAGQSGSHCHGRRHERNRHQKAQPF